MKILGLLWVFLSGLYSFSMKIPCQNRIQSNRCSFLMASTRSGDSINDNNSFDRFRTYLSQLKSPEFRRSSIEYVLQGLNELKESIIESFRDDSKISGRYFTAEVLFGIVAAFGCPHLLQVLLNSFAGILQLLGTLLLVTSMWAIRRSFSVFELPREAVDFVRAGPYQYVRHPMYTGILMCFFGSAFRSKDVYRLLGCAAMTVLLDKKASEEEILLVERFGKGYLQYSKTTKKFIYEVF